jgi:hypothetical protein
MIVYCWESLMLLLNVYFYFYFLINSGKCECALFGDYVDEVKRKIEKSSSGLPIVVVHYAKIKIFRGNLISLVMYYILDNGFDHIGILFRQSIYPECDQYY